MYKSSVGEAGVQILENDEIKSVLDYIFLESPDFQ